MSYMIRVVASTLSTIVTVCFVGSTIFALYLYNARKAFHPIAGSGRDENLLRIGAISGTFGWVARVHSGLATFPHSCPFTTPPLSSYAGLHLVFLPIGTMIDNGKIMGCTAQMIVMHVITVPLTIGPYVASYIVYVANS